jgi:hypothetical protein
MSDNDRSLNDSKGLEIDLENSISMIEYGLDEDDCCSSDNQVQISNNSSPNFVAVVPVIEITNTNKDETFNNSNNDINKKKLFKKNSKVGKIIKMNNSNNTNDNNNNSSIDQFDSGYSMKDVNSTTNLLGLEESSITANAYLNEANSKYSFKINNNSNTLLINAGFNSNSQSSIEPNGRYCKDLDSIPLVSLTSKFYQIIYYCLKRYVNIIHKKLKFVYL